MLVPLMTWPIISLSVVLIVLSFVLTAFILLHRSQGGGMGDLFGGGMSTSTGGTSAAERMLNRLTVVIGILWTICILGLLLLYKHTG